MSPRNRISLLSREGSTVVRVRDRLGHTLYLTPQEFLERWEAEDGSRKVSFTFEFISMNSWIGLIVVSYDGADYDDYDFGSSREIIRHNLALSFIVKSVLPNI